MAEKLTLLGVTNYRNSPKRFGIKVDDRRRHMYILGKTGMGKSTVQENMIIQDIVNGHGLAVIDPHGDLVEKVIKFVPSNRINDVVYFNPADMDYPIAFNVLEKVDPARRHLVASGMVGVFKKIWADSWGPRLEYLLRNAILALLDYPESTLLGVTRVLSDKEYRKKVVAKIEDPVVKAFWVEEFAKYTDKFASEAVSPIQNKVGQFLSVSLIRNIVGQVKSTIDMRDIMDNKKILLINLSKGRIGEDNSSMLGAMLITKITLAAMARVDIPEAERSDFYLYVDEFQNFATESFADILSEARKYHLCLIMGHQYIDQLDEKVRDAVFGNVGSTICMRVGAIDADFLEKEFEPVFMAQDLVNLPKYNFYIKLMIDGVASDPFSAKGLPPMPSRFETDNIDKIIQVSRERYSKKSSFVEEKIIRWRSSSVPSAGGGDDKKDFGFSATCSNCKVDTTVPFEPDESRPIYCKDCLKLLKEGKIKPIKIKPKPVVIVSEPSPSDGELKPVNKEFVQNTPKDKNENGEKEVKEGTEKQKNITQQTKDVLLADLKRKDRPLVTSSQKGSVKSLAKKDVRVSLENNKKKHRELKKQNELPPVKEISLSELSVKNKQSKQPPKKTVATYKKTKDDQDKVIKPGQVIKF